MLPWRGSELMGGAGAYMSDESPCRELMRSIALELMDRGLAS